MEPNGIEGLQGDVHHAARVVATEWPGTIGQEDLQQELFVVLAESSEQAVGHLRSQDQALRRNWLRRRAHQIAARYRDSHELATGNVAYSTKQVRGLLKEGLLPDVIMYVDHPGSGLSVELLDLREAVLKLSEKHAGTLFAAYVDDDYTGPSKELTRAVDALTRNMNRINRARQAAGHEGPGNRKAMSNAQSQMSADEERIYRDVQ